MLTETFLIDQNPTAALVFLFGIQEVRELNSESPLGPNKPG